MKDLIIGKHSIKEILKESPDRLITVYTHKPEDPFVQKLKKGNITISFVTKQNLHTIVNCKSHQGFVAKIKKLKTLSVKEFLLKQKKQSLVLMCDSINDPQNFGTIFRACECFGVDALIFSKNRNTKLTPIISKISSGASELVPVISVSNLANTVKIFQKKGYFAIATDMNSQNLYNFQFPDKTLLIIGNEEKGIRHILSKKADFHITIPMHGKITSLNVSQSTAVFLSHWRNSMIS
jgi:23S rRNA (guanosine2251-2'-O)-methyltransferase